MRYMMFAENRKYTDEDGNPSSLWDHLDYLRRWGGTPDCMECFETLIEAKRVGYLTDENVFVVDEMQDYRPVWAMKYEPETISW